MAKNFRREARRRFPWLQGALLDSFAEMWEDTGDAQTALADLRQTSVYSRTFEGNRRDDGTLRMNENQYLAQMVSYREILDEHFEDPRRLPNRENMVSLIEQEVSSQEFAATVQESIERFREPGMEHSEGLSNEFIHAFYETGSRQVALEQVRDTSSYRQRFEGNLRDDGTIRMEEPEYFAYRRGFRRSLLNRGVNPDPFEAHGKLGEAVESEISVEEFNQRLSSVEEGVLANTSDTLDFFTDNYGDEGAAFLANAGDRATALAMAIDPDVGNDLLTRRITASQIGGEAQIQGFRRQVNRAEELARAGIDQSASREFFGMAAQDLGGIGATTQRFQRGGTNLGQLEDAFLLGQGNEQDRIERAMQSEQSSFTNRLDTRRDERGGLTGLLDT